MPIWPCRRESDPFDAVLKANLDGDFSASACGNDAPSEQVISDFERSIGFSLPKDFRDFSRSKLGGIYIEVKEGAWPRAKLYDVAPF